MSTVRTRDGAVAALFVLLLVIAFAVLASIDMRDPDPAPSPTPESLTLEAPVSAPVVVDASLDLDVAPVVAYAIPPKRVPTPIPVLIAPEPEPVPVAVAAPAAPQAPASAAPVPAPTPAAPVAAPAPPSVHDAALALAARYGCGGATVVAGGTGGNAGYYDAGTRTVHYSPTDADLDYVMSHECAHARQHTVYGDWWAMVDDLAPAGGFEAVADCMSKAQGGGYGYYASSCGGQLGDAAAAVLSGRTYGGGA